MISRFLALSLLTLYGSSAVAQTEPVLPLAAVSDAVRVAVETCKAQGFEITVVVLDRAAVPRAILRGDRAMERSVDSARRKAYTAIKSGMSSADFAKSLGPNIPQRPAPTPENPYPRNLGVNGDNDLIAVGGGLLIRSGNTIMGAIGVAGAPAVNGINGGVFDEACAQAGLDKFMGR